MRTPVVVKDDYTVWYEAVVIESLELPVTKIFIHCEVYRWTPTVKKALKKDFRLLRSLTVMPIFAMHNYGDRKHFKFLDMFGFQYLADGPDNKIIYVSEV